MTLNQLKYLLILSDTCNITLASKKLFISQPALSTAIKELEKELGFEIIKRSNKGCQFTPLGEIIVEKAKLIVQTIEEITNLAENESEFLSGLLTIGSVPFASDTFLLDSIISLKKKYPLLKISLVEDDSFQLLKRIGSHELDVAIILLCNEDKDALCDEIQKRGLIFTRLFQDEMCFWVSSNNPLHVQKSATLKEILKYPLVYYKGNFNQYTESLFKKYINSDTINTLQFEDRASLKKYIQKTSSTMIMPKHSFTDNTLIPLSVLDCFLYADIGIVTPIKYNLSIKILLDELRQSITDFFYHESID